MMNILRIPASLLLLVMVTACVTINVYFPAEAAEKAADRIILDVYRGGAATEPAPGEGEPQSSTMPAVTERIAGVLLDFLVTPAQAAADISVDSPAIRKLKAAMESRHRELKPFYASGALGMTRDGQLEIRDLKLVPLAKRSSIKSLVSLENRDREALYEEIARANGHPEWTAEIRQTFARRWIDNAPGGWWYIDNSGSWQQK